MVRSLGMTLIALFLTCPLAQAGEKVTKLTIKQDGKDLVATATVFAPATYHGPVLIGQSHSLNRKEEALALRCSLVVNKDYLRKSPPTPVEVTWRVPNADAAEVACHVDPSIILLTTKEIAELSSKVGKLTEAPKFAPAGESLQGAWEVTSAFLEGKPALDLKGVPLKGMHFHFTKDTMSFGPKDAKPVDKFGFHYKLNAARKPHEIDLSHELDPGKPLVQLGIYELNGDELKLAWEAAGVKRPSDFDGKSKTSSVFILKRVEKKPDDKTAWQETELKKVQGRWTTVRDVVVDDKTRRQRVDIEFEDGNLKVFIYREEDDSPWKGSLKVLGVERAGTVARLIIGHGTNKIDFHYDFVGERLILVGRIFNRPYEGFQFSGEYRRVEKPK